MQKPFKKILSVVALAALATVSTATLAQMTVGVSWSNFQEERWKTDENAIKAQLEKLGAKYISADAGGSPEKQLGDIEGLMTAQLLRQAGFKVDLQAMDWQTLVGRRAKKRRARQRRLAHVSDGLWDV